MSYAGILMHRNDQLSGVYQHFLWRQSVNRKGTCAKGLTLLVWLRQCASCISLFYGAVEIDEMSPHLRRGNDRMSQFYHRHQQNKKKFNKFLCCLPVVSFVALVRSPLCGCVLFVCVLCLRCAKQTNR